MAFFAIFDHVLLQDYYPFGMQVPRRFADEADGYRYGFNGKERDNELKGEGNSYDFGARMYDPRIGRWFKIDAKQNLYQSLSPYHFAFNNPITTIDTDGNENIVVVGAQYDNSAGNKLMFAHQGIRQLKEYSLNEKDETRTMVLFTEGYSKKQIRAIEREVKKLGGTLVKVNTSSDLTNYINSKSKFSEKLTKMRDEDKVTNVDAFSHGVVGSIDFGYKTKNADIMKFDKYDTQRLEPDAFAKAAIFTSYACRTGIGIDTEIVKPWQDMMADQSLAQEISNNANITVKAYLKRTDYSNTLSSTQDRFRLKLFETIGSVNTKEVNWYQTFMKRLENRQKIDGATFDPEGAVHPVEGGDWPKGVSDEIQTYTPQQ